MEAKVHKACESWIFLGKNIKGKIISVIKTGKWEKKEKRRKMWKEAGVAQCQCCT